MKHAYNTNKYKKKKHYNQLNLQQSHLADKFKIRKFFFFFGGQDTEIEYEVPTS